MFPTDPDQVIGKLLIKMDGKEVEGKILPEETAAEKYEDALAGGNSAVMVSENKSDKDVLKINVGNILPSQEVSITLQVIKSLDIEGGAYCMRIPTSYWPRYAPDLAKGGESLGVTSSPDEKATYTIGIDIKT